MALQVISGNVQTLGSTTETGVVTVTPAEYPQIVNGIIISTAITTVNITAGVFSFSATKGTKIRVRAKDSAGKTFLNYVFEVDNSDTNDISHYLPPNANPTVGTENYVVSVNNKAGIVNLGVADIPTLQTTLNDKVAASVVNTISPPINTSITNTGTEIKLTQQYGPGVYYYVKVSGAGVEVVGQAQFGVAPNYAYFETNGTLVFSGAATVWNDMLGNASNIKATGIRVSTNDTEQTIDFNTSSVYPTDYAWSSYQLKHEWKLGSVLVPHIHWQQTNNVKPNWLFEYRWQINNGAKTTAWTKLPLTTNTFTYITGTLNQITYGADLTPPVGYSLSDILQFRLYRDSTNASGSFAGVDTYTGTAAVTSVDIHIECDMIGSRTQFTK